MIIHVGVKLAIVVGKTQLRSMGAPPVVVVAVVAIEATAAAAAGAAPGVLGILVPRAPLRVVIDLHLLETRQAEVMGVQVLVNGGNLRQDAIELLVSVNGGSSSTGPAMESDGDAPALVSDTNLVWRDLRGVRRGDTSSNHD